MKSPEWRLAMWFLGVWACGVWAGWWLRDSRPRSFTCEPGKEPEILWSASGAAVVTGQCGNPLIRYIPPSAP